VRPNILLIIVHDLGTHLNCYGHKTVRSPNLDALAAEGVRFENHFATATFCSPSRGAIITGKWPHSNGLMGLVNMGWNLPKHSTTLAQMLGEQGYETFLFGLQHEVKDVAQLGFQHVPPVTSKHHDDVAPVVAQFLQQRRQHGEQPFYARVGFIEVHRLGDAYEQYAAEAPDPAALEVPPYLKDTPGAREDLANYHGCIKHMDAAVGTILEALDKSGMKDNTIVVFTTDHGPDFPRAKGTLYDAGINTTLIIRWPDGVPGGQTREELISNIDLTPTLLEAAGVRVPNDMQGRPFLSLLRGETWEPNHAVFAEKNTVADDRKRCVHTARWKYIRNFDPGPLLRLTTGMRASTTGRDMGAEHLSPRPETELYDLDNDPNEQQSLSGDPAYAEVERDLASRLEAWMTNTDDPILRGPIERPAKETERYTRHGFGPSIGPRRGQNVRYEEMRIGELDAARQKVPLVYVPIGSVEYHGPHLPMGFDTIHAHALCLVACDQTGGVVLPPTFWGTRGHEKYPYSLLLREETVEALIRDVLARLTEQAYRLIVICTGHYPRVQGALLQRVAQEHMEHHNGVRVLVLDPFSLHPSDPHPEHAGIVETSVMRFLRPDLVDMSALAEEGALKGIKSDCVDANVGYGKERFDTIVTEMVRTVRDALKERSMKT